MVSEKQLSYESVLDAMGQGVLIFDSHDRLVVENLAARNMLGADLKLIRSSGWKAAATLFNTRITDSEATADAAREQARASARPVRFHIYRAGEYFPCWVAEVHGTVGDTFTMVTLEIPDWSVLTELMERFRDEVEHSATATQGHTSLILKSMKVLKKGETVEQLGKRIGGFVQLIATHAHRIERLMALFRRMEELRTGSLSAAVREERHKINLADFMEDFIEGLDEITLLDPESENQDYRSRISVTIPDDVYVYASSYRLTAVLHDLLRNAIMYSLKATPVLISAQTSPQAQGVQIDVVDEGYGIRAKEAERVFLPFERSRQPQIIGEFGYGLSLYLCKYEIEAMDGKIWFQSEEGVGTTFSFKLPLWREEFAASSSSDS